MLFLLNPWTAAGQAILAEAGALSVVGREALFQSGLLFDAEVGDYALVGNGAGLLRTLRFAPASGAVLVGGPQADFGYGKGLRAGTGTYVLVGEAAEALRAYVIAGMAGDVSLVGAPVPLIRSLTLPAAPAGLLLGGREARLRFGSIRYSETGAYIVSGQPSALERSALLDAGRGAVAVAGVQAQLVSARRLAAAAGSLGVIGRGVDLTYVRNPITPVTSFIDEYSSTADGTSYTQSVVVPADGVLILAIGGRNGETNSASVTVDGTPAQVHVQAGGATGTYAAIASIPVAAGTRSVVVTWSQTSLRQYMAAWVMTDYNNVDPIATNTFANAGSSSAISWSIGITRPAFTVGLAALSTSTGLSMTSGLTTRASEVIEGMSFAVGDNTQAGEGSTTLSITASAGASASNRVGIAAAW